MVVEAINRGRDDVNAPTGIRKIGGNETGDCVRYISERSRSVARRFKYDASEFGVGDGIEQVGSARQGRRN